MKKFIRSLGFLSPLLILLQVLAACVSTSIAPFNEPEPAGVVQGSPTFFEKELDRNLPIPAVTVAKLCEKLGVPPSCAALYQLSISSGTTDTFESWQREDLNFHPDCLPPLAKNSLKTCQDQDIEENIREPACWSVIAFTRARLIGTLMEEDSRPETASLKEAHALFTLQADKEKNAEAILALVQQILARDPQNLEAHRLRVQVLAPEVVKGENPAAFENSLRWLQASSVPTHHMIAWQAQSMRLELALSEDVEPETLQDLRQVSEKLKKSDPNNAWTIRSQALVAYYEKRTEAAIKLMQKAIKAPDADPVMGEELKKIGANSPEPFAPRLHHID